MNLLSSVSQFMMLAADETTAFRSIEYDTPDTGWGWLLLLGGLALVLLLSIRTIWKEP